MLPFQEPKSGVRSVLTDELDLMYVAEVAWAEGQAVLQFEKDPGTGPKVGIETHGTSMSLGPNIQN